MVKIHASISGHLLELLMKLQVISSWKCPCTNTNIQSSINVSLGTRLSSTSSDVKADDPLWDGRGCGSSSTCCSVRNGCGVDSSPP